jgi:hypothetical protein
MAFIAQTTGLLSLAAAHWLSILFFAPISYYTLLAVYRLTLHPLARAGIPGPKLAAATWLWEFYYEVINRQKLKPVILRDNLRQEYGPVVRINPDEVHIHDKDLYLEVCTRYLDLSAPCTNPAA